MKNIYFLFILMLSAGLARAVCPVGITAGGPVIFCNGDSVLLTAQTGTGYTYQWRRNGVNISGATAITYYAKTTGNYAVLVTVISPACSSLSNTITVTTESPLSVTVTEPGPSMCAASTDLLEASPFGANYVYQWYEDSYLLPGSFSYQMETGHDGNYYCTVTNSCGTYFSSYYTVTYYANLQIPQVGFIEPSGSVTICTGGSATFTDNYTCCGFFDYQWYQDGIQIPGANSNSYTATQPGNYIMRLGYNCWWTGQYQNFLSNIVTVSQTGQPFPVASITAGGPTTFCGGGSVTLNAATDPSWSFQWRLNNVNISGATASSYVATAGGSYTCQVYSACGAAISSAIAVQVIPTSVSITPGGTQAICTGTTITLTASSAGTSGTYQWQLNGSDIPGATASTYPAASGNYTCAITNTCGTFVSNTVVITTQPCAMGLQFDGSNDYVRVPTHSAYAFGTGNLTVEAWVSLNSSQTASGPVLFSNYNGTGIFLQFLNGRLRMLLSGADVQMGGPDLRDNLCHHIALTRSSPTTVNYYLDGALIQTVGVSSTNVTTTSLLFFGNHTFQSPSYALRGKIMEVRMWNLARTQPEIQTARNNQLSGSEPGLVGYWRMDDGSGQVVNDYSPTGNDGQLGSTTSADANDPVFAPSCVLTGCLLPTAIITAAGPTALCPGGSVLLNANTGTGLTYQWKSGGVNIPGATASSYTANVAASYTCVVTDTCGSNTSNPIAVTSQPTSVLISTPGSTSICIGSSITLTASSAGSGGTYQWKLNGIDIPGATAANYTASAAGNYTCSITNSCGTFASNTLAVSVIATCATGLKFDGSNDRVTIPDSSVYNLGTGDFTVEAWIRADIIQPTYPIIFGKRASLSTGFIVFLSLGKLTLQMGGINVASAGTDLRDNTCHHIAVTRSGTTVGYYVDGVLISTQTGYGQSISGSHPLWAGDDQFNPNAFNGLIHEIRYWNLARSQAQIQSVKDTLLSGNETGLIGYWRMNDGSGQSVNDYSVTSHDGFLGSSVSIDANDPIFVTACQLNGCSPPPAAITAGGSTSFCTGSSVTLNANTGAGLSYQWKLNTVNITGATSSSYVASTAGSYTCEVTNACGSILSNSIVVTVSSPVTAVITAGGSTTFCSGGSVTLNANTGTGLTYQWRLNTVNIPGATLSSYVATAAGTYTCVVTNSCGSTGSNSIAVTVNPPPTAVITAGGSTILCAGGTVTLIANTGTGLTYQWKLNGGNIPGATAVSYTAGLAGNYTCAVTNSCGSTTSNTIVVTILTTCLNGLQLDGINDRVTVSDTSSYSIGTGDFTVEVWMKAEFNQSATFPILVSKRASLSSGFILYLATGQIALQVGGVNIARAGIDLRDNTCHHVAVNRTAGTVRYFVDGVLVSTQAGFSYNINAAHALWFGNDEPAPNAFNGMLHEIRFWNLARSQSQIQAAKDTFLTGTEPGLIGYWKMNEGSGQVVNDYSPSLHNGYLGSTTSADVNDPVSVASCFNACTLPSASITAGGATSFCAGGSVTLNANTGTGLSYQWRLDGINIGGANSSSYIVTASGNYTCVVTNNCGGVVSNTISVTVLATPPSPGVITGLASGICGNTTSYTIAAVPGASVYTWSVPAGVIINSGQGTTTLNVTFPIPFTSSAISVTAGNTCGTSGASSRAVFSVLLPPGPISGLTAPCSMSRHIYSIPAVAGATNYTWTVPPKAKVMNGQGTSMVEIRFHQFGGNITVRASNACTTSTLAVLPITIIGCTGNPHMSRTLDATVYPNPSSTAFTLQVNSPLEETCWLVVTDMTGRIVEKSGPIRPGEEISFGNELAPGIYSAEVLQGEERKVLRVVKSE